METENSNPSDQRITNIMFEHWYAIKGDRKFPSEKDLDPVLLEGILPNSYLIKADGIIDDKYNYKYIGQNIIEAYGSDIAKELGNEQGSPFAKKDKLKKVLETGKPLIDEGEFVNVNGDTVKYRQCIVPLSDNGFSIDSIFGGMRYKIFPKERG